MESTITLSEIESVDHALIVSSYTRFEQPMINHRIRKATLKGASVNTINSKKFDFNFKTELDVLSSPQKLLSMLQSVLKSLHDINKTKTPGHLSSVKSSDIHNRIAGDLIRSENALIVLGEQLNSNPSSAEISNLILQIALISY